MNVVSPRFMKKAPASLPPWIGISLSTQPPTSWAQEERGCTLDSFTSGSSMPRPGAGQSVKQREEAGRMEEGCGPKRPGGGPC